MRKIIIAAIAIVFMVGCSATKRAAKFTHKGLKADSSTVVKIVRKIAPCVTTKLDTTVIYDVVQSIDTMIWMDTVRVQCPDSAGVKIVREVVKKYFNIYKSDSFYITRTVIKTVQDKTFEIENRKLQMERDQYKKQKGNWQLAFFIILSFALLELVAIIITLKNKIL